MEKTFCDKCGLDITEKKRYSLSIYDRELDDSVIDEDLCPSCFESVVRVLASLKK